MTMAFAKGTAKAALDHMTKMVALGKQILTLHLISSPLNFQCQKFYFSKVCAFICLEMAGKGVRVNSIQ